MALRDRDERQLQEHDREAVQGDEQAVVRVGQAAFADVERQGRLALEVHEGTEHGRDEEDKEGVVAEDRPQRLASLLLAAADPHAFGQCDQGDDAEGDAGERVAEKDEEERLLGEEPGDGRAGGEPGVDREAVERERGDSLALRRQVRQKGRGRGPVQLAGQPGERGQDDDRPERVGLRQEQELNIDSAIALRRPSRSATQPPAAAAATLPIP
jgi:hypothetical protein